MAKGDDDPVALSQVGGGNTIFKFRYGVFDSPVPRKAPCDMAAPRSLMAIAGSTMVRFLEYL